MDREELLAIRKEVWDKYEIMKKLGDYDANAPVITLCLKSLVGIINHLLEEMKKKK